MIVELGKTILTWLVVIVVVAWILVQFFTDPVGSANFVSSVISGIGDGLDAIKTFVQAL